MSSEIPEIPDDFRGGNTIPLGNRKRKYEEIPEIPEIPGIRGEEVDSCSSVKSNISKVKITKQTAFHWVLTWANYPCNWKDFFEKVRPLIEKLYIGEEICPTTGTPHLQGWLKLKKKNNAITYLHLPEQIHWAVMFRNATEKQNTNYCGKEKNTYLSWGVPLPYVEHVEMSPWMKEIEAILKTEPDSRSIYWVWEPIGKTGKTSFIKMMLQTTEHSIIVNGKGNDIRHCVADYIEKKGCHPRIVFIDVPRVNKEYLSYEAIENIKNMLFYSGKYEGTIVNGPRPHVIIFANSKPDYDKFSDDRWKVARIYDQKLVWASDVFEVFEEKK